MDTESVSARLDRICVRLDQIQNQNVDVLEMKTQMKEMMAAQNVFQSQFTKQFEAVNDALVHLTDKQAALEKKTPQVITTLHQEKTFMRDQLSQAQQEILGHLTEIKTKMGDGVNSSMMDQNIKMLNQLTESMKVYSDFVMDIGVKITEQDSKLNQLKRDMSCIRESSCMTERTRSRTEQVDNTKPIEHMEQVALKIDTFLLEVRKNHAELKGMTKAEFVWLESMIDKKLTETQSTAVTNLQDISTVQENIKAIRNHINTVETIATKVEKKIETMGDKVDKNVETIVNRVEKSLKEELYLLTQKQSEVIKQQEKSSNDVKALIERTKHEIWAMTEKEAQLVRDRIEGPLPSHGKYTFYFHVLNFKSLVRSGKSINSLPWYINEIKSCVRGFVFLSTGGQLIVGLVRGRNPLCVGLQPSTGGKQLKFKATILDICNKKLPDLDLGEGTCTTHETGIPGHIHTGWGTKLGVTSCDDLVQKGYGDKEGYTQGTVLIIYDVTVS